MKVVIELLGNESKQDLLATSNYLRELAGEIAPVMVEKKTDLDKLADAVVESTKVHEEAAPVKTVSEHIAEERAKNRTSRTKKVEEPAPAPIEEPEEAPAPVEEAPKAPINYTVEECKQWAMKALNVKKRPLVQEAFEKVGATSFPTLKESMFAEFIEYISTRL